MFLKNKNIIFKIRRSKVTEYAALKLKCLPKKPTQDDIIEAKKFYIQLFFERYKGKLVLRN